jgi:hypothetical protein
MTTIVGRLKAVAQAESQFDVDARGTYFALRSAAGFIAIFLPIVLVGWGAWHGISKHAMSSLSSFYWLSLLPPLGSDALLRNWFVGSLVAVGICLIAYEGYGTLENWLLNLAGGAVVVVALFPMPCTNALNSSQICAPFYSETLPIHYIAAITFFLLIGSTIWFCANDTLADLSPGARRRWRRYYRAFAVAMVAAPLLAFVSTEEQVRTIWVEVAGVWVFSGYWFTKSFELSRISKLEPPSGPAPKIRRIGGKLQVLRSPGDALAG